MKISRDNYEIWFTDWMDNNLSASQINELNYFLDRNPDLREEFTDLCVLSLRPVESIFPSREKLKRKAQDIPEKQFELICAATIENDLDEEQDAELKAIIFSDPEKLRTLQIFRKLKLKPAEMVYSGKKNLIQKTTTAKIIRLAKISLSAAAIVMIVLISGIFKSELKEQVITSPVSEFITEDPVPESNLSSNPSAATPVASQNKIEVKPRGNQVNPAEVQSTTQTEEKIIAYVPEKINFHPGLLLPEPETEVTLVASNMVYNPPPTGYSDEGRSKIGRFIASRFRSGVLNEADPTDTPLRSYEIAEAGIDGLNKLLGWEMALTRNNDENGETQSVRFNSRLLKFNAPVKNNQQAE